MHKLFKCGDIVATKIGKINDVDTWAWCKVLDLIVDGVSNDEFVVITGLGDKNTNLIFKLNLIGTSTSDILKFGPGCLIIPQDPRIVYTEKTHDIVLIETDYMEMIYIRMIEAADSKINFIRNNKNRIEKLEDILSDTN